MKLVSKIMIIFVSVCWINLAFGQEAQTTRTNLKGLFKSQAYQMEMPYEDDAVSSARILNTSGILQNVEVHGLVQLYFVSSEETVDQFKLRRGEISFKGTLTDNTSFFVMIDPAKNTQGKKDSSILQDLGLTLKVLNNKVMVGQFKRPISLEGLQSSTTLELLERATIVRVLGDKRDMGVMVQGEATAFKLQYMVGVFNGEGPNVAEANQKKDVAAMVIWKPTDKTQLYASAYEGSQSAKNDVQDRVGTGGRVEWGPVAVKVEYLQAQDAKVEQDGWYVLASYPLAHLGIEVLNPVKVAARYEEWDANKDDAKEQHTWTLGAQYSLDPKDISKVGVDFFYLDGKGQEQDDYGVSLGYQGKF